MHMQAPLVFGRAGSDTSSVLTDTDYAEQVCFLVVTGVHCIQSHSVLPCNTAGLT